MTVGPDATKYFDMDQRGPIAIVLPPRSLDRVSEDLRALTQAIHEAGLADASGYGLGGEFGYGVEFTNDVFEMHPFWWGECECGFEAAELDMIEANPHRPDCFSIRYQAEEARLLKDMISWPAVLDRMTAWAKAQGYAAAPSGMAGHCDCGAEATYLAWSASHGHDPACPSVRPNFRCGELEVRWYKWIGRDMEMEPLVSEAAWIQLFGRCLASLAQDITPSASSSSQTTSTRLNTGLDRSRE